MYGNIVWNERYDIGIDIVDKAHRQLFSVMCKMFKIIEETSNVQHSCEAGIKYFKNYAVKHFAEEEAYMTLIKYKGYNKHKEIHDEMLNKTIPKLEKELLETNYSDDSVQHFLGVCLGWLTGHVMIEDHAITGRINEIPPVNSNQIKSELAKIKTKNNTTIDKKKELRLCAIENAAKQTIKELFDLEIQSCDKYFDGAGLGKSIYYRLTYGNKNGGKIKILMIIEENLVLKTVGKLMNIQFKKIDNSVVSAAMELSQQFISRVGAYLTINEKNVYKLERDSIMNAKNFNDNVVSGYFNYNLSFTTEIGNFAFCIKNL